MEWSVKDGGGLVVEDLSVAFDRPVLRELSLTIPRGGILSLVGPSGCGKTTLLRTIAGLNDPHAGRITIDGVDVVDEPAQRRPTGLVFQTPTLFPNLSVRENIAFGLDDAQMSDSRRNDLVDIGMAVMNIAGLADRKPNQLSGGQGQRVSLARTIVRRPRVLLLDEPVAHVEAALRHAIHTDIDSQVRRMGMSAIYVTHDISEACMVGDQIAIMKDGQIVQQGPSRSVYHQPNTRFVAHLMGVENILAGTADTPVCGSADVTIGRISIRLRCHDNVSEGPVTVFVPPESIELTNGHTDTSGEMNGQIIVAGFARSHMVYDVETAIGTLVVHEPASREPRVVGTPVTVIIRDGWAVAAEESGAPATQ